MNRRQLCLHAPAVFALTSGLAPSWALAQGGPQEGVQYVRLAQPVPTSAGPGKVEVIEFFWYGCPHCFALETPLEGWIKRLPPEVAFRRVHVGFGPMHQFHQRMYYALEAEGLLESLHRKVFQHMHVARQPLLNESQVEAFMNAQGQDGAKFVLAMKSFGVIAKAKQAQQLTEAYRIDGVPSIGIGGRYYTSVALAGGPDRVFAVADYLIAQVRRG